MKHFFILLYTIIYRFIINGLFFSFCFIFVQRCVYLAVMKRMDIATNLESVCKYIHDIILFIFQHCMKKYSFSILSNIEVNSWHSVSVYFHPNKKLTSSVLLRYWMAVANIGTIFILVYRVSYKIRSCWGAICSISSTLMLLLGRKSSPQCLCDIGLSMLINNILLCCLKP